jgi:6-phosphogluconolactonase
VSIHYFDSLSQLASQTVKYLSSGNIALSGGSTYAALFPHWLALKPDCTHSTFFPVDERVVPFEDEQSNWGMIYRNFLRHIGRQDDKNNFPRSVDQYLDILNKHFPSMPPVFDAIFLSAGEDGHTASLFPGEAYLDDMQTVVLQTHSPKAPPERITLGPGVLTYVKKLVVVIAGKKKAWIVPELDKKNRRIPVINILCEHPAPKVFVEKSIM